MAEIIKMPRLSDTMEVGNIIGWLKNVGDKVAPGDVLAEVETDKATMELDNFYNGVLLYIAVKEGEVPVDSVIAVIGDEGEDYSAQLAAAQAEMGSNSPEAEETPEVKESSSKPEPVVAVSTPEVLNEVPVNINDGDRVFASPLAKKMAAANNIDLKDVKGTGDLGRIVKRDVLNFDPATVVAAQSSNQVYSTVLEAKEVPVSMMRKAIGRRLSESKFTAPHFYLVMEIDMEEAIRARKALNEIADTKISFNDMIVKASAMALRQHPNINASWMGDKIVFHDEINVGVAVAIEDGLMVPVINHADQKSLSQINVEVKDLAGKARERKLGLEQMQGNTFTISNLGMFGIEEFTAIINPPDACILAVGGIITKPVVKNGEIVVGNTMKLSLSCDHRIVDGVVGSKFLQTLKLLLENPVRILL